jgi:hypothetical protein
MRSLIAEFDVGEKTEVDLPRNAYHLNCHFFKVAEE